MEVYQKHRTALLNAFNRECNQFDKVLRDELAKRNAFSAQEKEELYEEISSLRDQLKNANGGQQERGQLQPAVEADLVNPRLPTPISSAAIELEEPEDNLLAATPGKVLSIEHRDADGSVSREMHGELVDKFNDLTQQYNLLQDAHQTLLNKYRKEKATIKSWAKYMEKHRLSKGCGLTGRMMSRSTGVELADGSKSNWSAGSEQEDIITPTRQADVLSGTKQQLKNRGLKASSAAGTVESGPFHQMSSSILMSERGRPSQTKIQHSANLATNDDASETTDGEEERKALSFNAAKATGLSVKAGYTAGKQAVLKRSASSPDSPVVVSERSLKRKGAPPLESAAKPIRIKSEYGSSSPLGLAGFRDYTEMQESLDLDEVGDRIDTPRKRRRFEDDPIDIQSLISARDRRGLDNSIADGSVGVDRRSEDAFNDRIGVDSESRIDVPAEGQKESTSHAQLTVAANRHPPVLQPSSPNLGLLPRTPRTTHPKSMAYLSNSDKRLQRAAAKVPSLAEDGEEVSDSNPEEDQNSKASGRNHNGENTTEAKKLRHQRLNDLLEGRSPAKLVLFSSTPRRNVPGPLTQSKTSDRDGFIKSFPIQDGNEGGVTKNKRSLPEQPGTKLFSQHGIKANDPAQGEATPRDEKREGSHDHRRANTGSRRKQRSEPLNTATPREKGRLRDKPLNRLTLEDFKVNPSYSAGYDYAYTETVRNRDQRKCVPGCTRPDCCGRTFRKALELGGIPLPVKRALVWNSSQEQEDEEQRLLEDYLGEGSSRLNKLSREERNELVIQARTKQFADKHGRHRQAFQRRTTPPGFWRADMPTTQELEEDREQARRMERDLVEERHREAMRPRGKWAFRDE